MTRKANISDIIRTMMTDHGFEMTDIAEILDKPLQSVRNKFSYDRFSIKEIILMLQLMEYEIRFHHQPDLGSEYIVSPDAYLNEEEIKKCEKIRTGKLAKQLSYIDELLENIPDGLKDEVLNELALKIDRARKEQ